MEAVLAQGQVRTLDPEGTATTCQVGEVVRTQIRSMALVDDNEIKLPGTRVLLLRDITVGEKERVICDALLSANTAPKTVDI